MFCASLAGRFRVGGLSPDFLCASIPTLVLHVTD